jgi:hypothetical protein
MKLTISAILLALFCNLSNATTGYDDVVFEDVPSYMEVGQQVRVSWSTPRDYVCTSYRPSIIALNGMHTQCPFRSIQVRAYRA